MEPSISTQITLLVKLVTNMPQNSGLQDKRKTQNIYICISTHA